MIQRLQSIFLFLSSCFMGSSYWLPFGNSTDTTHAYLKDGLFNINDNPVILGLIVASVLICLIDIFLFSNRKLQMSLCLGALMLIGGAIGIIAYTAFVTLSGMNIDLGFFSPILAAVMTILAFSYIRKDEKLVKSMDRLR